MCGIEFGTETGGGGGSCGGSGGGGEDEEEAGAVAPTVEGGVPMCPADDTGGCWGSGSDVGVDEGGIEVVVVVVGGGGSGCGWHVPLSSYNFWCSIARGEEKVCLTKTNFLFSAQVSLTFQQCSCYYSMYSYCHLFRLLFFPLFILTLKNVLTD